MRIGVIGGGGMIGSRIVQEALDRGHYVTSLVRSPAASEAPERLTVVRGDALDPELARQLDGHEVVVSAVGTARADEPDSSMYRRCAENLVEALRGLGDAAPG